MLHILLLVLLLGFIAVIIVSVLYEKSTGISAVPVLPWTRHQALSLLIKFHPPHAVLHVADLGCGWGGMIRKLHKAYPKAKIVGYETSPFPYILSKIRFSMAGKNVQILNDDFFKADLSQNDVVFCYLSPKHMELKPQLLNLKAGSLIVSCSFPITGWTPIETRKVWSIVRIPVYIYRV